MMVLPRAQEKGAEDKEQKADPTHVLHTVLGLLDTDHLVNAIKLAGCEHMRHFIRMQVKDITHLQYNNDDGLQIIIPTWYQENIQVLKEYHYHKH